MFYLIIFISFLSLSHGLPENYGNFINENEIPKKLFRPVVLIHGLLGNPNTLDVLQMLIEKEHPGTLVYNPRLFMEMGSFDSLWDQVNITYQAIISHVNDTDGINLVAYSQGGLVARGMIETLGLKVRNFISLSSPQAGQYGDYGLFYFNLLKEKAFEKFYLDDFFRDFSVPQYWNDPHHRDLYLKYCKFLPVINNEISGKENETYVTNFKKLNKLVLVGGPDDEVVTPWQSSYFSYYDENDTMIDFKEREIYKKDLFGLRTLDEEKKLQIYIREGVGHHDWYKDGHVLMNFVLPWLD